MINQLKEEGRVKDIMALVQILDIVDFSEVSDRLPDFVTSMRRALLDKITSADTALAAKEEQKILNEALPSSTTNESPEERVESWIKATGERATDQGSNYTFQVCSNSLEDYPLTLELTPPCMKTSRGAPAAPKGHERKSTTMVGNVLYPDIINRDFQSEVGCKTRD